MLDAIEIETGDHPVASVLILHGLGADGNDFVPVAHELDLRTVGPVRFLFPHAPHIPVTVNGGYRMPAWYDILGPGRPEDEAGLRHSLAGIEELLAREKARGIPAQRIVLAGFSQGCAMSLLTGLRHAERLAGVVGLSGYLPLAEQTAAERSEANRDVPIFLAHGRNDTMVPLARGAYSREVLEGLGYQPEWHEYPMEHSVCPQEIADLEAWLRRALA